MRSKGFATATILALMMGLCPGCANTTSQGSDSATATPPATAPSNQPLPHPNLTLVGANGKPASIADVVEKVLPSVVSVSSTRTARVSAPALPFNDPFFRRFFGRRFDVPRKRQEHGLGSGVVVAEDVILTNHHVVKGADEIQITTADKQELDAELVRRGLARSREVATGTPRKDLKAEAELYKALFLYYLDQLEENRE